MMKPLQIMMKSTGKQTQCIQRMARECFSMMRTVALEAGASGNGVDGWAIDLRRGDNEV
jgi:hypothetical protein